MLRNKLKVGRKKTEIVIDAMEKGDDKIKNQDIKILYNRYVRKIQI